MAEGTKQAATTERDPFLAVQPVWLIDTDRMEIDHIQSSLSPEVIQLTKFDTIADTIATRLGSSNESYGTLIVNVQKVPDALSLNWDNFVIAINKIVESKQYKNRLFIFEINNDSNGTHVFLNSHLSANVDDFLASAHNVHLDSVTHDDDVSAEAKQIIVNLQVANKKQRTDIEVFKAKEKENNEKIRRMTHQIEALNTQIGSYREQAKSGEKAKQDAEKAIQANKEKMASLQKQIDDLNKANADLRSQLTDLTIDNQAKEKFLKERNQKIVSLTQINTDLQKSLDDTREKQNKILNARNEMESNKLLAEQLNAANEKLSKAHQETIKAQEDKSVLEMQLKDKDKQIEEIRAGYQNVNRIGYSNNFAPINLHNTDVMYFKIIDPLPFHAFYIKEMVKMMRQLFNEDASDGAPSKLIKTIYYKIDFGQDKYVIGDYPVIGNLSVIQDLNDTYRLLPSLHDDEKALDFESKQHIIVFLDYIQDDKYYLTTDATIDYYTIAQHDDVVKALGLKGSHISYETNSLLNLKYNERLINMTQTNQQTFFTNRLVDLLKSSQVISKYVNQ